MAVITLISCSKQSHQKEADPCDGISPLSAGFRIEESFTTQNTAWPFYATDTVSVSLLKFTATDSLASSYEWYIGAGFYTTRSVQLEFPSDYLKQHESLPITLIVKGKPNVRCFFAQDSIASLTKEIYFTDSTLVAGKFYGYFEGSASNLFTVDINPQKPCSDIPGGVNNNTVNLSISNLVKGCEILIGTCYGGQYKTGYKQVLFAAQSCQSPGGTIKVGPDNNTVTIDYAVYENGYQQPAVHKKFTGTRIK